MVGQGPFGEKAVSPDEIVLSKDEIARLRRSSYKVALSFHYTGTNWARLHESGIRATLEKYGIRLVTVTDAHFDPNLQVTQLDGIRLQDPDADHRRAFGRPGNGAEVPAGVRPAPS